jgi:hypothetical protein
MISADAGTFSVSSLSPEGKAVLKKFLSDPNAGKLWEIDVPPIVDNEPAIPHNYWIRGILGELAIYKKLYKPHGFTHMPKAPGYDLHSATNYVQVKTLKNPNGAVGAMREAARKLVAVQPPKNDYILHILKKPGSDSNQLRTALQDYIDDPNGPIQGRISIVLDEFELTQ